MNETELSLLQEEVRRLRRAYRTQRFLLSIALTASAGLITVALESPAHVAAQSTADKDGIVHVRGLVVEDPGGHERVRLGAPLPDPLIHGVRRRRDGAVSGLLISDANGNERGGYVTSDVSGEAFVTLDSEDDQLVMLLANPKGGANFYLRDKGNLVQMTVFAGEKYQNVQLPDGPKLTMSKAKQTVLELPAAQK
jgi:hypothetical protein